MILKKVARVHYVAVGLSAQHKKIAQAMLTKLCMMYDMIPSKYPLYLATQSQSYGAIKLYSRLGFTPYLGAYKGCTEQRVRMRGKMSQRSCVVKLN